MGTATGQPPQSANAVTSTGTQSRGERFLPCLLAAMEACWLDALLIGMASMRLFQLREPFMPLWAPFVLLIGSCTLFILLEGHDPTPTTRRNGQPATLLSFLLLTIVLLLVLWSGVYAQVASFFDPAWLLTMLNDLLFLNPRFYQVLAVLVVSLYMCWRGMHISRRVLEPGHIFNALRLGMGILLAVIIIRMGAGVPFYDESLLLLLLPIFLSLALVAHALARAIYLRRSYVAGLQGSIATQERTLFISMAIVCLCLLVIGLLLGTFTSPTVLGQVMQALTPLGVAYDWLTTLLAHAVIFILTPIVWLLSLLHINPKWTTTTTDNSKAGKGEAQVTSSPDPHVVLVFSILIKIVLPLLCIGLLFLLMRLAMKRRRSVTLRRDGDLHESLWSWNLFLSQLRALFLALWRRFFPVHTTDAAAMLPQTLEGAPTARDIRAIYRALLTWAAARGHARRKDETPYEFEARLDQHIPHIEPQLQVVTDIYTATRYGEIVPEEAEVAHVQQMWRELQQKPLLQ